MMKSTLNGRIDQANQIRQAVRTMKISALLALLTGWTFAAAAQTNAPETRPISLQDCIQDALARNLDLRIARYTPRQAQLDLKAAYAGYDPTFSIAGRHAYSRLNGSIDPTTHLPTPTSGLESDSFNSALLGGLLPWGTTYDLQGNISETYGQIGGTPTDQSRGGASVTLTQPLLKNFWMDGTRLNIRVAKNDLKISELDLKGIIMSTATSVETAYYDLIAARENVKVQEKAVELAVALLNENKKRVEFGAMTPLDAQDAEAQAATSQAALIKARQTLGTQLETVKKLTGDNFAAWAETDLVPVDPLSTNRLTFDLQQSWTTALTQNPAMLTAKLALERQGVIIKYSRNQLFPQLDLVGSYGHNASGSREFSGVFNQLGNGSQPAYYYGAQISFPLAGTGAHAAYKKSKLTLEELLLSLKRLEQNTMIGVHNGIGTVNANYDSWDATRQAREFAEAALNAEQVRLQNGKSTTYTVLQKQRDLTATRASEIQALADYNKALASLSLAMAQTLDRLGINLEVK